MWKGGWLQGEGPKSALDLPQDIVPRQIFTDLQQILFLQLRHRTAVDCAVCNSLAWSFSSCMLPEFKGITSTDVENQSQT